MNSEAENERNNTLVEADARPTNADVFLQCLEDVSRDLSENACFQLQGSS